MSSSQILKICVTLVGLLGKIGQAAAVADVRKQNQTYTLKYIPAVADRPPQVTTDVARVKAVTLPFGDTH